MRGVGLTINDRTRYLRREEPIEQTLPTLKLVRIRPISLNTINCNYIPMYENYLYIYRHEVMGPLLLYVTVVLELVP